MLCGKNRWKIKIRTHLIFVPHNKANFLLIENYHLRKTIKIGRIQIGNANTYIGKKYQKIPIASVRFKDSWNHDPEGYVKLNLLSSLPLGWNLSIFPARFSIGPNMSQIVDIYLNAYTPTPGSILFQVTTSIEGIKDATDPLLLRSHELNLVDWTLYVPTRMWVTIPAFRIGESIPSKYSCKGLDASPPILWNISTLPPETKSLALIMFDPTAPKGTFIHWILYNISPTLGSLPENIPKGKKLVNNIGIQGINDFHKIGYDGPCPPPGPEHIYIFRILALDIEVPTKAKINTLAELRNYIKDHIIAFGDYVGFFGT